MNKKKTETLVIQQLWLLLKCSPPLQSGVYDSGVGGSESVRLCPGGGGGGLFFDKVELPLAGVCATGARVEGGRFDKGGAGGKINNIKQHHAVMSW